MKQYKYIGIVCFALCFFLLLSGMFADVVQQHFCVLCIFSKLELIIRTYRCVIGIHTKITDNVAFLHFPWHFPVHIMSQRVQALKFFSSIVKYLNNLLVHTIIYRTSSTSRCFMDGPANQMLFITGHVSSTITGILASVAVPYSHAIYWFFHLIYTQLSHQSIKLSPHISLLSIKHYLFAQTNRNVAILMEMSIHRRFMFSFSRFGRIRYVLKVNYFAHVNHSKSATQMILHSARCWFRVPWPSRGVSGVIKDFQLTRFVCELANTHIRKMNRYSRVRAHKHRARSEIKKKNTHTDTHTLCNT